VIADRGSLALGDAQAHGGCGCSFAVYAVSPCFAGAAFPPSALGSWGPGVLGSCVFGGAAWAVVRTALGWARRLRVGVGALLLAGGMGVVGGRWDGCVACSAGVALPSSHGGC